MAEDKKGTIMSQPCTFLDVMPTCLELAETTYPSTYNDNSIKPLCNEARSFVPLLQDKESWDEERTLYWEHERGKAVRKGNWRLTALADGGWQLFDLAHDLSETNNVAAEYPEKVREMKSLWNTWAQSVGLSVPEEIPETKTELIFHYPFDDSTADASPSQYALTPSSNDISYGEGKVGRALHLDGNAQYLDLNTTGIFDTGVTQTTFCAWVYDENTEAPNANDQVENGAYYRDEIIFAQKDNAGTGRIYLYARAETPVGGGTPSFFYNSFLSGSQRRASAGSLQPGTWQHVAIVCDPVSQSVTYFINGERDCTVSTGAFETCTGGFRIGGHKSGKNYFKGYIDDAWFFKGLLSPEQIRQIRDNTFDPTPYYPDSSGSESASTEWPLKDHVYTIRNYSSTPAYMVDNEESDNRITCEGSTSNAAYWVFEPTDNAHSYYVRNYTSGRYIQDYTNASGQMVAMGNEKVEYYVQASESEGGRYGFASTSVSPHDFSSGTIGLNLRAESNQANCYVQTYAAAAGTNHRSFWTLTAVPDITIGIDRPVVDNEQWQTGNGQISTLNGVTVDGKWVKGHPGIYIQNGRKVARRRAVR